MLYSSSLRVCMLCPLPFVSVVVSSKPQIKFFMFISSNIIAQHADVLFYFHSDPDPPSPPTVSGNVSVVVYNESEGTDTESEPDDVCTTVVQLFNLQMMKMY